MHIHTDLKGTVRIALVFIAVVFILVIVVWLGKRTQSPQPKLSENDTLRVVASFYPVAHLVEQITGDSAEVYTLISPGLEPHDFEPTPQDNARVQFADLFVFNGAGLEPWASELQEQASKNTTILDLSQHVDVLEQNGEPDPHVWLDPLRYVRMAEAVAATLSDVRPSQAAEFQQNAARVQQELVALDEAYRNGLSRCTARTIIVSHDAFQYLGASYNLEVIPIAGVSPEEEPSPQQLAHIAELAREKNVTTIFFETLVSPKLAETIANEVGVRTAVLNPVEGLTAEQHTDGLSYSDLMYENLNAMRQALRCE